MRFAILFGLPLVLAPAAGPTDVIVTENRLFHIPIQIEKSARANLNELRLYVSMDEGKRWRLANQADAQATHFEFRAPASGTYWFSLQTISNRGQATPPDVSKEPPGLRVLVSDKAGPDDEIRQIEEELALVRARLAALEKRLAELRKAKKK